MVKSKKSKRDKGEEADENSEFGADDAVDGSTSSRSKDDKKGRKKAVDAGEDAAATLQNDAAEDGDVSQTKDVKKATRKKKGNRKAEDDDDGTQLDIIAAAVKSKQSLDVDDDDDDGVNAATTNKSKKSKKGKAKKTEVDDEDDEPVSNKTQSRKLHSVFELLDVEEPDDMDDDQGDDSDDGASKGSGKQQRKQSAEEEVVKEAQKPKKEEKGAKKSKKKKKDDDEEDIDKMLAELELEYKGEKPKKSDKGAEDKNKEPDVNQEAATLDEGEAAADDKKKKKKKKKGLETAEQAEAGQETKSTDELKPVEDDDNAEEGGTVKTAAQKKKEKKERDRQKKLAQKASDKTKQEKQAEKEASAEPAEKSEVPSAAKDVLPAEAKADEEDDEQEGDEKKKKKDKKKKKLPEKDKDKEEKDKKRPGKKQLLLMQETLKKIKDEEERMKQEEEAKIRAAEEAERLRLEKIQLEKERKERRKLKEKEKKDRLKAEGKLLTKTQKQQKARAAATLEALKAHGFDVPSIGEKREKVPRLGTRIRPNKNKKNQAENADEAKESVEPTTPTTPTTDGDEKMIAKDDILETENVAEKESEEEEVEDEEDDVKDAWDASSSSGSESEAEEKSDKKIEICIKDDSQKKPKSSAPSDSAKKLSSVSSSEGEDSSDEDDEDDDEDDSESESESDSEDSEESEEDAHKSTAINLRQRALDRIQKRREEAEKTRSTDTLRSPIVCVLGHVDTGKTKILDKIRHTHVQDGEAGGITQQIGATMVPVYAIKEQAKMVKNFGTFDIRLPGLLIIDTPGHESFSNLRSRGSSLCDIAILVVDIMHGLEPQTIESINLLKLKKTPFIVALNKVDRLYDWKATRNKDIRDAVKSQNRNTQMEFEQKLKEVIVQFAEQSLNAALFYDNKDTRTYVSMVPTSASTGEGMGNLLALVVELTQNMLTKRLAFSEELQATVLELKAIPGLGTTVDVILVNGRLKEGDTVVLAGMDGPVVTQIRSILMPQPLKELRVKNPYEEFKEIQAAQGVKITAKDLDKVIAGLNLLVANHPDEVEILKEEVARELHAAMSSIKLAERGVYVQASTLGSLEALLEFLRTSKIPYSGIRIGPVVKRDVMKASIMLEHDSQYAVILAFDVKIERDAQELADGLGVKIFAADIIYHLFDRFIEYRERLKQQKRDEFKHIAVFPCKLRILPQFIFNSRDPIVLGVSVEAGVVKEGTPICVPTKEALEIGIVTTIEINHKTVDSARKGQEVCVKIEPIPGESPKMYGRHFDNTDMLVSKITRQSIDACKEYFRDDLSKTDWQLMIELKKLFQIL